MEIERRKNVGRAKRSSLMPRPRARDHLNHLLAEGVRHMFEEPNLFFRNVLHLYFLQLPVGLFWILAVPDEPGGGYEVRARLFYGSRDFNIHSSIHFNHSTRGKVPQKLYFFEYDGNELLIRRASIHNQHLKILKIL